MYYDNPGGRPQSAHMTRTGSRTGFGQRESIGNPLNLSLGRIRPMSASTSRTSFVPGVSAKSDHSAPPPPMYAKEEPQVQSGYFVPAREAGASLRFFAYFEEPILQYNSRSVPYHTNRIHKCIITFHPKDATVGVDEPKVRNSGYGIRTLAHSSRLLRKKSTSSIASNPTSNDAGQCQFSRHTPPPQHAGASPALPGVPVPCAVPHTVKISKRFGAGTLS